MKKTTATVLSVLICPYGAKDSASQEEQIIYVRREGIMGDRHIGTTLHAGARQKSYAQPNQELPNLRQLSVVAKEEMGEIARRLGVPEVTGSDLGANIVLQGVPNLTNFPSGVNGVLSFSRGPILYCMGANEPCINPGMVIARRHNRDDRLASKFSKVALGWRGIVAMVAVRGDIVPGDTAMLHYPKWTGWSPER